MTGWITKIRTIIDGYGNKFPAMMFGPAVPTTTVADVGVHALVNTSGMPINPATDDTLSTLVGFFVGAAPVSRSLTTPTPPASTPLFPANPGRRKWCVAAPQTADLWLNPLGGPAAVGGVDCFCVPAGAMARSDGLSCETTAMTVFCAAGGLAVPAWEA